MVDYTARRAQLMARLKELDNRLHDIEAELEEAPPQDWQEAAAEREDDEVLERMGEAGQQEVARIRSALDRMRRGEYGICVKCGGEISEERLDVLPATPFCRDCAV